VDHFRDGPLRVMADDGHDLVVEKTLVLGPCRLAVALQRERLLRPPRDAVRRRQVLGGQAHREHPAAGPREEAGMKVDRGLHRQVVHVLHAPDHLDVFRPGRDRVARLRDRLERGTAKPVHRRAGHRKRQAGEQRRGPTDVAAEFAPLLRRAQHDVLDRLRIDAAAIHDGLHDRGGQFVAPDVPEQAALGMRLPDRRAAAGDHDGRGIGRQAHRRGHPFIRPFIR